MTGVIRASCVASSHLCLCVCNLFDCICILILWEWYILTFAICIQIYQLRVSLWIVNVLLISVCITTTSVINKDRIFRDESGENLKVLLTGLHCFYQERCPGTRNKINYRQFLSRLLSSQNKLLCDYSVLMGWTAPIFVLSLYFNLNYTPVKLCDCILHGCDAIMLTKVHPRTDKHPAKYSKSCFCGHPI